MPLLGAFSRKSFPKEFGVYGNLKYLRGDERYRFIYLLIVFEFCHMGAGYLKSAQNT